MNEVSDEQLFIIMQYLWERGMEKKRIKQAADVFYKMKSEQA